MTVISHLVNILLDNSDCINRVTLLESVIFCPYNVEVNWLICKKGHVWAFSFTGRAYDNGQSSDIHCTLSLFLVGGLIDSVCKLFIQYFGGSDEAD